MRWLSRGFVAVGLAVVALYALGPREPVETAVSFDERLLGGGVDAYFAAAEARVPGIRPGSEKRVIWAGEAEVQTPVALVYFHGFSASSEEIRPVPDEVAAALGANLVYTRFRGHGRGSDAMAEGSVQGWMQDAAEALAVARRVGERVIVLSTSTGGSIAAVAMLDEKLRRDVAGVVFVSPNFGLRHAAAPLLTVPAARHWLPLIVGDRRSFEPRSPEQAKHWTTEYPSVAVFPMAALARFAAGQDYSRLDLPALFYYSNEDKVVRADLTKLVQENWGGSVTHAAPDLKPGDDGFAHVVTGRIMSPGTTAQAVALILDWARALP